VTFAQVSKTPSCSLTLGFLKQQIMLSNEYFYTQNLKFIEQNKLKTNGEKKIK